jgi:hypothetical protein
VASSGRRKHLCFTGFTLRKARKEKTPVLLVFFLSAWLQRMSRERAETLTSSTHIITIFCTNQKPPERVVLAGKK